MPSVSATHPDLREAVRPAFSVRIDDLVRKVCAAWENTPTAFPDLSRTYEPEEQRAHERALEKFLGETAGWNFSSVPDAGSAERLKLSVMSFLPKLFPLSGFRRADHFFDRCWASTWKFIRDARRFDPSIRAEEVYQALRNVLIVNSIQAYLGLDIAMTPSAFAYSLLYPYTDNHLDDNSVADADRGRFLADVRKLLSGEKVSLSGPLLMKVARLISMIDEEHPRSSFPDLHESLLAIHAAQERSITGHSRAGGTPDESLLALSVEKGGTSVLADAYLAAGDISDEAAEFMVGYGAALQLIDDLQDMAEDRANSHRTVFTCLAPGRPVEETTNRLLNFTRRVLDSSGRLPSPDARALGDFSAASCCLLVTEAAACATGACGGAYLRRLEPYSQFSFEYLRALRERLRREYLSSGGAIRTAGRRWDRAARLFSPGRARRISL